MIAELFNMRELRVSDCDLHSLPDKNKAFITIHQLLFGDKLLQALTPRMDLRAKRGKSDFL